MLGNGMDGWTVFIFTGYDPHNRMCQRCDVRCVSSFREVRLCEESVGHSINPDAIWSITAFGVSHNCNRSAKKKRRMSLSIAQFSADAMCNSLVVKAHDSVRHSSTA